MDYQLVVVTTALFCLTLCQCCFAAGGDGTSYSEDPATAYFIYLISNHLLFNLTHKDSTSPTEATIRVWLQKLGTAIGTTFNFSVRLGKMLVTRCNNVRAKVKSLRGGPLRQRYLQQQWEMRVLPNEHTLQQALQAAISTPSRKRTAKHYSKRHERRLKRQRVTECNAALSWLQDDGRTPVQLLVLNRHTNAAETITLDTDLKRALDLRDEHLGRDMEQLVSMMLYIKDKCHVSGRAYHEMASLCQQMPRHYRLKERIRELNSKWNIYPTPNGTTGVQQPLRERLVACIEYMVSIAIMGLEKYNDCMTKDYFRASSHRGDDCLIQILQKQNRIECLEWMGAKRQVRTLKCSKYKTDGHNIISCPLNQSPT